MATPSDGGCIQITNFPAEAFVDGVFFPLGMDGYESLSALAVLDVDRDAGLGTFLFNDLYWEGVANRPTFPRPFTLAPTTNQACLECITIRTCTLDFSNCSSRGFLASEGSGSYTAGTFDADAGVFAGTAMGIKMLQWDFRGDRAFDGGSCVQIGTMNWNVSWPAP